MNAFKIEIGEWTLQASKEDGQVRLEIFTGGERTFNDVGTIEEIDGWLTAGEEESE